jgi:hypothetical protein
MHDLYGGLLLELRGVTERVGQMHVTVCGQCLAELRKENHGHPPQLSIANNLWIGQIPWQLETLTFPKQLLIALLYPRVYVFKLFPKDIHARPDASTLQRGMQETVSTCDLDMEGAELMVQGDLLPQPTSILPSVISVTFIGKGKLPKHWLQATFRVHHQHIFGTLTWLKTHNKYYGDISIDTECICELPEDDVPAEIVGIIHQTMDIGLINQKAAGYVPAKQNMSGKSG